jgi:hypothetical protein
VSNHGGRQLDGAIATLDALPAVAEAVGGRVPVLLDGGVRRGTDVLKALALGAAPSASAARCWGLAAGGLRAYGEVLELPARRARPRPGPGRSEATGRPHPGPDPVSRIVVTRAYWSSSRGGVAAGACRAGCPRR